MVEVTYGKETVLDAGFMIFQSLVANSIGSYIGAEAVCGSVFGCRITFENRALAFQ